MKKGNDQSPGSGPLREIPRIYESISDREQSDFPKAIDCTVVKGIAVGMDAAGHCRPFAPGLAFLGFCVGQNDVRVAVQVRGSIILKISGATAADRGRPVFCNGPNSFALQRERGAAEIGVVRFFQDGRSAVAFRREGDQRPLNLKVDF